MNPGTMEIKPIETTYNGYRFRSRLEARWAVFFDTLGIKYEYESQGFKIGDICYLPDFYLPHFNLYCEIKHTINIDINNVNKINAFTKSIPLLLIIGSPGNEEMFFLPAYNCPDIDSIYPDEIIESFQHLRETDLVIFGRCPFVVDITLIYKNRGSHDENNYQYSIHQSRQERFQ